MTIELKGCLGLEPLECIIKDLEYKGVMICREVSTMDLEYTIDYAQGHRVTRVMTNIPLTAKVTGIKSLGGSLSLVGYTLLGEEEYYDAKIDAKQVKDRDAVRCMIASLRFSKDMYKEICDVLCEYIENKGGEGDEDRVP